MSIDANPQFRGLLDSAVLMPERELPVAGRPPVCEPLLLEVPEAHFTALASQGRLQDAIGAFRRAVDLKPGGRDGSGPEGNKLPKTRGSL